MDVLKNRYAHCTAPGRENLRRATCFAAAVLALLGSSGRLPAAQIAPFASQPPPPVESEFRWPLLELQSVRALSNGNLLVDARVAHPGVQYPDRRLHLLDWSHGTADVVLRRIERRRSGDVEHLGVDALLVARGDTTWILDGSRLLRMGPDAGIIDTLDLPRRGAALAQRLGPILFRPEAADTLGHFYDTNAEVEETHAVIRDSALRVRGHFALVVGEHVCVVVSRSYVDSVSLSTTSTTSTSRGRKGLGFGRNCICAPTSSVLGSMSVAPAGCGAAA